MVDDDADEEDDADEVGGGGIESAGDATAAVADADDGGVSAVGKRGGAKWKDAKEIGDAGGEEDNIGGGGSDEVDAMDDVDTAAAPAPAPVALASSCVAGDDGMMRLVLTVFVSVCRK